MEKRLFNIFKTTNATKVTKATLKASDRALQESPCLIFCMIFKEKYFSGYILRIYFSGYILKIYDVAIWSTNSCNTYIAQYLTK